MLNANFLPFQVYTAADVLQRVLCTHYERELKDQKKAKKYAYDNTLPFLHRWQQGRQFIEEASRGSIHVQPLLLFYGFTHFMKALILLYDPTYPSSTSVLAHGVSTRKRKRKHYRFIDDEVKIQRNGLFPLLSKMFHVKTFENERFPMRELFLQLPFLKAFLKEDVRFSHHSPSIDLSQLLAHYLLLYNLSMITRYETDWWGELISQRTSADLPLIETYTHACPQECTKLIVVEAIAVLKPST